MERVLTSPGIETRGIESEPSRERDESRSRERVNSVKSVFHLTSAERFNVSESDTITLLEVVMKSRIAYRAN